MLLYLFLYVLVIFLDALYSVYYVHCYVGQKWPMIGWNKIILFYSIHTLLTVSAGPVSDGPVVHEVNNIVAILKNYPSSCTGKINIKKFLERWVKGKNLFILSFIGLLSLSTTPSLWMVRQFGKGENSLMVA